MTRKRLNIKPYNEFWFQNCIMHALAQITGSLGIIDCLLFDCIFTYEFEWKDGKPILIFKQEYHKGWIKCLEEKRIYTKFISAEPKELINKIKVSIDKDCPVIANIDCFFESLRRDCYGKSHVAHTLLIIGYDDTTKLFQVLEHNFKDDLYYKEQVIPYMEVVDASVGYTEHISKQNIIIYAEIDYCKADRTKTGKQKVIVSNLIVLEKMLNSLPIFKLFNKNIESYFMQSDMSKEEIKAYYHMVMGIVNLKRVFYSQIEALHLEYNILNTELLLKTINDWNILMGLLGKMVYSGFWSKKTLLKIVELFKSIYKTECLWLRDAKNDFLEVLA